MNDDPVVLAERLIACDSVTPATGAVFAELAAMLEPIGFAVHRFVAGDAPDGPVENLVAIRAGTDGGRHFAFAGHLDVVPPGQGWTSAPFAPERRGDLLYGRGAVDMKGAIAAMVAAVTQIPVGAGTISFLITGDEEGPARFGTVEIIAHLRQTGQLPDLCLVGEPTSSAALGDMIKVGRRGSLNCLLTVEGVQGHVAYPHRAANPVPVLIALLHKLQTHKLDDGFPEFQPSNLEVTDLEVGNPAHNVIPARASARLNIRFNPRWKGADLVAWIEGLCREAEVGFNGRVILKPTISGEAFFTQPDRFVSVVSAAVEAVAGRKPELSTSGGTSDARFFRALCPVLEFGLLGTTMHMVDERTPVAEVEALTQIYEGVIAGYFQAFGSATAV